jgi:hypothetical protein
MSLLIDLPPDVEAALRQQLGNLDELAKEACLVELYRQGKMTHHQLAKALGLDRYSADGVLKQHGVTNEISPAVLERQIETLSTTR